MSNKIVCRLLVSLLLFSELRDVVSSLVRDMRVSYYIRPFPE